MYIDFEKFNENSYVLDSVLLGVEYDGLCAKYDSILELKLDNWHPKLKWIITPRLYKIIPASLNPPLYDCPPSLSWVLPDLVHYHGIP